MAVSLIKKQELSAESVKLIVDDLSKFLQLGSTVLVGKHEQLKMAWCCILAGGHLLVEDLPGMGKTTMVKTMARLLNMPWKRIQCTNDMLPADITGGSVYDEATKTFKFIAGPIFTNLVMADELNRASPKSQSAFLQAMEETSVTVDGQTYQLPTPFVVIATQNSLDSAGTNPLPESQLDRFMMSLSLGLPARDIERQLLMQRPSAELLDALPSMMTVSKLSQMRDLVSLVHVGENVADYLLDLANWLRSRSHGLSPRTVLALTSASKAWAISSGRDFVTPSDVQAVALSVLNHRLTPKDNFQSMSGKALIVTALQTVEVNG